MIERLEGIDDTSDHDGDRDDATLNVMNNNHHPQDPPALDSPYK